MNFLIVHTPLKFLIQDLWRDEAFSYLLASRTLGEILTLTAQDFTPPLYYLLLHGWMMVFGSSEVAMRSLSVFFFTGMLYYIFDILTQTLGFSYKKAGIYLVFFALNPLLSYYAFEVRPYAMVAFFAVGAGYAYLLQKKRLFIFMMTAGLYTHYFMILVLAAFIIYQLSFHTLSRSHLKKAPYFIFPIIFWLPWALFMLTQKKFDDAFWIMRPTLIDVFYSVATIYTGYEKSLGWDVQKLPNQYTSLVQLIAVFLGGFLLLSSIYVWKFKRHAIKAGGFFLLWSFIPMIIVFISSFIATPLFIPRYLIMAAPGLLLYLVWLFDQLPKKIQIITGFVLIVLTFQYQRFQIKYREKSQVKSMYTQIKSLAKTADQVYVTDVLDLHLAQYYFYKDRVNLYGQKYSEIPSYVGKVLIPPEIIQTEFPVLPGRAFVVSDKTFYIRSQY